MKFKDWYEEDEGHNTSNLREYRDHKKNKRLNRAIKTLDIDQLLQMEEDE
jgi:hypothetical protein